MSETYFTLRPNSKDDYLEFELQNVAISTANAIRRVVLSDIEVYAIDDKDIKIEENTCPLHNEYISHRISILPINQAAENLEDLVFYLCKPHQKTEAIENDQNGIMDVTTDNLSIYDKVLDTWVSPIEIFLDSYLITKLNVKQKILGSFKLRKGTAKEHTRWQTVSTISYRYKVEKDAEQVAYDKISLEDERKWVKKDGGEDPQGFIFYLETCGLMEPRLVIKKALDLILNKIVLFKDYVDTERAKLGWTSNNMLDFEYEGEMHTLGNLIATNGLEQLGENDFIGYRIIHPMMNKFILRMKLEESSSKDIHISKLIEICTNLETHIKKLITSWEAI